MMTKTTRGPGTARRQTGKTRGNSDRKGQLQRRGHLNGGAEATTASAVDSVHD